MPVTRYNELDSPNGAVSVTGSVGSATPPAAVTARATGTPAIVQTDGTASPRVTVVTRRAEGNTTPGASTAKFKPGAVQSFTADSV